MEVSTEDEHARAERIELEVSGVAVRVPVVDGGVVPQARAGFDGASL